MKMVAAAVLLLGVLAGCTPTTNRERPSRAITKGIAEHANELWRGSGSDRAVMAQFIREIEPHRKRMLSESIEDFYARVSDEELRKRWVATRELTRTKLPVLLEMAKKLDAEGEAHWNRSGRVDWKVKSYTFPVESGRPERIMAPISDYQDYLALQNYAGRLQEVVMELAKLNGTYQELLDAVIAYGVSR